MLIKIETERFFLSTLNEEFSESVLDYYSRNASFFQKYSPAWPDKFLNPENIEKMLRQQDYMRIKKLLFHFYIYHKSDKKYQYILGDISYSVFDNKNMNSCLLGYQTDFKANGNGIATESLLAANQYIFNKINLNRIEALVMPTNIASIKVLEKIGFEKEGLARKILKINNEWEDHFRYSYVNV